MKATTTSGTTSCLFSWREPRVIGTGAIDGRRSYWSHWRKKIVRFDGTAPKSCTNSDPQQAKTTQQTQRRWWLWIPRMMRNPPPLSIIVREATILARLRLTTPSRPTTLRITMRASRSCCSPPRKNDVKNSLNCSWLNNGSKNKWVFLIRKDCINCPRQVVSIHVY